MNGHLVRCGICAACAGVLMAPQPANGTTVAVSDGQMKVTATAARMNVIDVNPDGLAFRVHDSVHTITAGEGCVLVSPQEAVCGGLVMVIRIDGGDGDDLLGLWDVQVPVIARGGAGGDLIETGRAADDINAGSGRDAVESAAGADTVMGGSDQDRVKGGPGKDALEGGEGPDVLRGDDGEDRVAGGPEGDLVDGGPGNDVLMGDEGENAIVATEGADTVITGTDADAVYSPRRRLACRFTRRGRRVNCARTRARFVAAPSPASWPPRSQTSASEGPHAAGGGISVFPRYPGHARRLSVYVQSTQTRRVRLCIRIFGLFERFIGRFPKRVVTERDTVRSPRLTVHYGTGVRQKRGCRRRIG